jgi:hypothetical protein
MQFSMVASFFTDSLRSAFLRHKKLRSRLSGTQVKTYGPANAGCPPDIKGEAGERHVQIREHSASRWSALSRAVGEKEPRA